MGNFFKQCIMAVAVVVLLLPFFALPVSGAEKALDHFIDGVEAFDLGNYDAGINAMEDYQKRFPQTNRNHIRDTP